MFTLPGSLQEECTSIMDVKVLALPYRVEMAVCQLSTRLFPLLSWQSKNPDEFRRTASGEADITRIQIAHKVNTALEGKAGSDKEFAGFLLGLFLARDSSGIEKLQETLGSDIQLSLHGCTFPIENKVEQKRDSTINRNCFIFFTLPFYPKVFGRYSSKIKIVVTRKADLISIPSHVFDEIRDWNTHVLSEHNVKMVLPEIYSPSEGIWDPEYEKDAPEFKMFPTVGVDNDKILSFMKKVHESGITFT
jgi:hypothetical protein